MSEISKKQSGIRKVFVDAYILTSRSYWAIFNGIASMIVANNVRPKKSGKSRTQKCVYRGGFFIR